MMSARPMSFLGPIRPMLGWLAVAALLVSALWLRLSRLDYPFWLDELWVVQAVETGGDRNITPPLFHALLRAARLLPWSPEINLRLPALGFGLLAAALPLVLTRARRPLLDRPSAMLWSLFLVASSPLVFYGACVKSYTAEVAFAVAALGLFLAAAEYDSARAWTLFGAAGIGAVTLLYPLVFLYAGTLVAGVILAVGAAVDDRRGARRALARVGLAHAAIFAAFWAAYRLYLKSDVPASALNERAALLAYWHAFFWDGSMVFVWRQSRQCLGQFLNLAPLGVPLLGVAWGFWLCARTPMAPRRKLALTALVAVPWAALLVASRWRLYPFGAVRLALFMTAPLFLLASCVFVDLLRARPAWRIASACLVAVLLVGFIGNGVLRDPYAELFMHYTDHRPLHAFLRDHVRRGEPVLADDRLGPELRRYLPQAVVLSPAQDGAIAGTAFWRVVGGERESRAWTLFESNRRDFDRVAAVAPCRDAAVEHYVRRGTPAPVAVGARPPP